MGFFGNTGFAFTCCGAEQSLSSRLLPWGVGALLFFFVGFFFVVFFLYVVAVVLVGFANLSFKQKSVKNIQVAA